MSEEINRHSGKLDRTLYVHATNATGLGAASVVSSLLPEFEKLWGGDKLIFALPDSGPLGPYSAAVSGTRVQKLRRRLPKPISRVVECLIPPGLGVAADAVVVLGDLPIRGVPNQVVFAHQPNLVAPSVNKESGTTAIFRMARMIFRMNVKFAKVIVVQTEAMREGMVRSYPGVAEKIVVVPQPVPAWVTEKGRVSRRMYRGRLRLFYPAAGYPHKNHRIFDQIRGAEGEDWPVESVTLTVGSEEYQSSGCNYFKLVGRLDQKKCLEHYHASDALIFPSLMESYGLPLVEAMWLGLPIVCADRPYARVLCGDDAIYFEPTDGESLKEAILELDRRLRIGWVPNWGRQLEAIPETWREVASKLVGLALS